MWVHMHVQSGTIMFALLYDDYGIVNELGLQVKVLDCYNKAVKIHMVLYCCDVKTSIILKKSICEVSLKVSLYTLSFPGQTTEGSTAPPAPSEAYFDPPTTLTSLPTTSEDLPEQGE